jgi:hypothetical protein
MFPETITINVTQEDLDNGGQRDERPDGIYLALKRDYPEFEPRVSDPNGGLGLIRGNEMGWYPNTNEFVSLVNKIDLTDGDPRPIKFTMRLSEVIPAPKRIRHGTS